MLCTTAGLQGGIGWIWSIPEIVILGIDPASECEGDEQNQREAGERCVYFHGFLPLPATGFYKFELHAVFSLVPTTLVLTPISELVYIKT